ncbi:MAG: sulfite reductase flavoprotein subunit alpha [Verrucomicrobiota bacterium]
MEVPYIPKDAPFSADQRSWLGGFLAGLHSRVVVVGGAATEVGAAAAPVAAKTLDILYGTQTGNSEELANEAAAIAKQKGYQPRVADLDSMEMDQLAKVETLLVVISTYGEGEMPDNAHLFWEALSAGTAPRLESMEFGVLALGDTSYEFFCQAGKMVDTRLEQLGATRMAPRLDCDLDYEEPANEWLLANIPQAGAAEIPALVDTPAPKKSQWNKKNPYPSPVVENVNLSGEGSAKEIRHIAFDLSGSDLTYEAGDALGVMPVNASDLVSLWLARLGASPETKIPGKEETLEELLTYHYEISNPSQDLLVGLEPLVKHEEFSRIIAGGDRESLMDFLWGKDALDIMNLDPEVELDPAVVISWLKPLSHRAYSISSSPNAHPGEVHLTVAAVRWEREGREHRGVCSTYIADQLPAGKEGGVFMLPNKSFRIPEDDSVPMVMVGPGTGIAPFRAFLEERRHRGAEGTNWLYFGDQHRMCDFIYEEELTAMVESGDLDRLELAFSRDQEEKVYVQNKMKETGAELFGLLEQGGHFYVCGDATRMAKDVDAALHEVIATHGNMDADAAADYVAQLKKSKRYVRDVY